jgi:hypothetical protein
MPSQKTGAIHEMGGYEYDSNSGFQRVENAALVTGQTLAATPGKIWDEIRTDLSSRPEKVMTVAGISTAAGFGVTSLLTKFPRAGTVGLAVVLGYQGIKYGGEALGFLSEASHAGDDFSRKQLVDRGSSRLGNEGALFIESAPGLALGGSLASKMVGTPPLYSAIGRSVDNRVIQPISSKVNETWAFYGPGRMKMPAGTLTDEGFVNVLKIEETLAGRHPWSGVETGRSIDLLKGKISRPITGTKAEIDFGFAEKPGRLPFHTHNANDEIPSLSDVLHTMDVGLIRSGERTTFYLGQAREYKAAQLAGRVDEFVPKLKALTIDHGKETARTIESNWTLTRLPGTNKLTTDLQGFLGTHVDYQAARTTLSRLDITKPWSQIGQIPVLEKIPLQDDLMTVLQGMTGGKRPNIRVVGEK